MLRNENLEIDARMRVDDDLPKRLTPVVDTGAGPSVITEN